MGIVIAISTMNYVIIIILIIITITIIIVILIIDSNSNSNSGADREGDVEERHGRREVHGDAEELQSEAYSLG